MQPDRTTAPPAEPRLTGSDPRASAPSGPAPLRLFGALVDASTIAMGASIIALVFSNVILHFFGLDIAWTTELSELLMVWVTFIGGAAAARRGEHVAISELVDLLGGRGRQWADASAQIVSAIVLLLLIGYGMSIVVSSWSNRLTVLNWPMSIEYLALPVGSAATLVFVLFDLVQIARGCNREDRFRS
jgi:TRAP-type C4-dicarboxylate transport system permease small subunit